MRQLGGGGLLQLTPPPVSTRVTLCGRTAQVWPRLGARRRRHPAVAAAGSQSGSSGFDNSPTVSSSRQAQSANEELVESEAWTAETAVGAARRRLAWAQRLRQQEEAPQQLEGGRWAAGGRAGETVHGEASTSGRGAAEAGDVQWEAAQRLRARQMASASAAAAPLQQAAPAPPQQPSTARYFFAGAAAAVAIHYLVNFLGTLPVVRRIVQRFIWSSEEAAELPPPPWPLPPWPPSQLPPWPPAPLPPWPPAADGAAARGGAASLASTDVAPEGTAVAGVVSAHAGESVEWVNMCWRKAWRVYQRGLERWIQDLLQMLFDMLIDEGMVPQFVQRLRIMEFTLDHEAPYVSNMRRRTSRKDSDLNGVVDVRYCGGARMLLLIEVGTGRWRVKVPVLVSDLDLESSLWLKIRLAPMCPYIGTISLAFVGQPSIRVQLSPYSRLRLMKIPVLQPFLRKLLTVDLPALMTLPKRLEFSIPPAVTAVAEAAVGRDAVMRAVASAVLQADALEHALLAALPLGPQGAAGGVSLPDFFRGELGVTLREARDLPVWGFPWQSNPYCRITLGKQAVVSRRDDDTSHAGRHRAPVWNQEFQFLVEDPMVQSLEVTIRDSPMTGRTDVGRASLPLSSLPPDGLLDVWLPVESSMPGEKVQGAVLLSLSYKSFQDDDADPGSREAAAFAGLPPAAITDVKSAADASSRAAVAASAAAAAVAVTKAAAARAAARMARSGKEQQQQGEGSGGDGGNGSNGAAPPPAGGATPAAAGNGAVVTDPAHLLTAKSSASSSGTGSYGASAASNGNVTEAEAGAYAGSLAKAVNQVLQQEQQKASAAANGSGAARARAATAASAADRARVNQLSAMAATMQQLTAEVDSLLVGGDKEAAEMAVRAVAAAEAAAVTAVVAGDVFGANQALQEAAEALEATVERMASGAAAAAGNPGMRTLQDRFEERFYLAEDLGRGSGAGAGESAEESGGEQRRAAGAGVATAARTAQRRVAQALAAAEAAAALAEPPGGAGGTEADSGAVAESAAAPAAVDEAAGTSSSAAGDAGAPGAEASAQEEEKEEQPQGWLGALASLWSKPQQEQPKQQPKGKGGEDDAAPAGKKARPKPKRPRQKGAKGGADEGGAGVGAGAGAAGAGESQPLRDIVLPDDIPIEEIAAELQNSWKLREQHVEVLIQKAVENRRRQSEQPWLVLLSVMATTTTVLLAIVLYRLQTGGIP